MADYTYDQHRKEKQSKPEYWWRRQGQGRRKPVHECVFDAVRFLHQHQGYRHEDNLRRVRLYGNLPVFGLSPGAFRGDPKKRGRVRINIGRSVIDTATSFIAKERPRPTVVTDGGDYRLKRHAKQLGKYCLGVFQQNSVYKHGPKVFRDGGLTGTGCYKGWVDWDEKRIKIERVFIDSLLWDDAEAHNGMPQQLFHYDYIARDTAIERWGRGKDGSLTKLGKKILNAPQAKPPRGLAAHRNLADSIQIVESWHLPSKAGASDGRRALVIENATLEDEEWEHDRFPFAFFTWGEPLFGFTGMGAMDQLTGIQVSLNKHMDAIEEELGLAVSRILVPSNGDTPRAHWVNRIGQVLTYAAGSQPPHVLNPDMIPPGRREQIMFLLDQAFQVVGVNQLSATGKKPPGLNSGAAQREYQDIQSERFATTQRAFEEMFVDLARLVIVLSQELYGKHKDLEVTYHNSKKFLETIRFGEIDIHDHPYELSIFPTSMLPKTPAARYAQINEWVQAGYLSKEEGMRLMDMPDLEDATSLMTAAIDDIDETVDAMIYDEPEDIDEETRGLEGEEYEQAVADLVYRPPDGTQNLQLGVKRMLAAYLRSKHDGTPEARRQLLERWMDDAKALMQQAQPQPQAAPGGPGGPQQAPPGGPPGPGPSAPPPGPQMAA